MPIRYGKYLFISTVVVVKRNPDLTKILLMFYLLERKKKLIYLAKLKFRFSNSFLVNFSYPDTTLLQYGS